MFMTMMMMMMMYFSSARLPRGCSDLITALTQVCHVWRYSSTGIPKFRM
jgi:hypothetical protein